MRRLAILGGSTPFTAALVEALADRGDIPPCHLLLHGRDKGRLDSVGAYARHRLGGSGWEIQTGTDLEDVLQGANIVVHQIRYGDLAGRAEDEQFAHKHGSPPDETLGPGALRCLLRSLPELNQVGAAIHEHAPNAWVVNLTNPLSATTSILADQVGARCVGVCELPEATARAAAELLGLRLCDLEWSYSGLNHRGFVHDLKYEGRDVLPDLVRAVGAAGLGGISAETISDLGAIPTKYFGLMSGPGPLYLGRAAEVAAIRSRIAEELAATPRQRPPSLKDRPTPWYRDSLVPILSAFWDPELQREEMVATVPDGPGPAFERRGHLSLSGFVPRAQPRPSTAVSRWVTRYVNHEQAVLNLSREPSVDVLRQVVLADPLVAAPQVDTVVNDLSAYLRDEVPV